MEYRGGAGVSGYSLLSCLIIASWSENWPSKSVEKGTVRLKRSIFFKYLSSGPTQGHKSLPSYLI